jgi:predicted ATPase
VLTGFSIRNFKNLAAVPPVEGELIPFGPVNVLIGPNGSGKSSLLQAIDFLRAFLRSSVEVYLQERGWEASDLPNLRNTSKNIRWELTAELDADEEGRGAGHYHYIVAFRPKGPLNVAQEFLEWTPPEGAPVTLLTRDEHQYTLVSPRTNVHQSFAMMSQSGGGMSPGKSRKSPELRPLRMMGPPASVMSQLDQPIHRWAHPEILRFRDWIEGFRSYLIWDPKVLRRPDRGKEGELGPSGEHLAMLIGRLKDQKPKEFERLVRRLRRLFPNLTDLSVSGRGWGWREIRLHEGEDPGVVYNSRQMSDGILRLLAITSLLYIDRIPSLITLEEPENGVHPQLVREVVEILREITQRKPPNQCQVFFTTHSPFVLDEFIDHPEQVYLLDRPKPLAGATVVRLSDKRELQVVRETFEQSLGEAWTSGLLGSTAGVRYP